MLNIIWAIMILIGIIFGAISGNFEAVTQATINSSREAVTLCISMLGVIAMWSGLMEVADGAGLIEKMTKKMNGILVYLFPNIESDHPAKKYIATNMIANIMGLGWAATPAGLMAMKELRNINEERKRKTGTDPNIASDEMCTFMVINISSLQLIPVNMIAYRSQYGSVDPAVIIAPGLTATLCSTLVAIIVCRALCKRAK